MKYIVFISLLILPAVVFSQDAYQKLTPEQGAGFISNARVFKKAIGIPLTNGLPNKDSIKFLLPRKSGAQVGFDTTNGKKWTYDPKGDSVFYDATGGGGISSLQNLSSKPCIKAATCCADISC